MSIFVIGINHKTASVALREKVYFSLDKLTLYLQDLLNRGIAREAVLLSTCNRSELYCEADNVAALKNWLSAQAAISVAELDAVLYVYQHEEAIAHIMQVACGLDSMVLGESQILGQLKEAYSESCTADAVGPTFHRLFQQVFALAKDVRTTTAIGACPVSVASASAHFAKQQTENFAESKVLLIGAGDTTDLLLRYLGAHLRQPLTIINRSADRALALAEQFSAKTLAWEQLSAGLSEADIVFSATGSALPIVQHALVKSVMATRVDRPLMLIDIAVPRDIEASVAEIPNVTLFCIDDLKTIIERHRQGREHAADKVLELIKQRSVALFAELNSFDRVAHTIRAYRGQIEEICQAELLKSQQQLLQGMNPADVLDMFAQAFTKKLLHAPSVQLRQAGAEGRFDLLTFAKQLFAIPDHEVESL